MKKIKDQKITITVTRPNGEVETVDVTKNFHWKVSREDFENKWYSKMVSETKKAGRGDITGFDFQEEEYESEDTKIAGYSELMEAYRCRREQMDLHEEYIDRLVETSIGSGNPGDVESSRAKVTELEKLYPIAKMYIKWSNGNPACSAGYAARKAADALYAGATLEEAQKIATEYNHFD